MFSQFFRSAKKMDWPWSRNIRDDEVKKLFMYVFFFLLFLQSTEWRIFLCEFLFFFSVFIIIIIVISNLVSKFKCMRDFAIIQLFIPSFCCSSTWCVRLAWPNWWRRAASGKNEDRTANRELTVNRRQLQGRTRTTNERNGSGEVKQKWMFCECEYASDLRPQRWNYKIWIEFNFFSFGFIQSTCWWNAKIKSGFRLNFCCGAFFVYSMRDGGGSFFHRPSGNAAAVLSNQCPPCLTAYIIGSFHFKLQPDL